MKILVPLKRVPDPDTRIRVKPDGSGVETEGVNYAINPFDAIALEEALRIEEKIGEIEIVVVSIGGEECAEQLRTGLAMGADRALLVRVENDLDPLAIAKVLAALYQREQPDFVLMGKQAIDDDSNQVGQMLAAMLGIGQATFVSELELLEGGERHGEGEERHGVRSLPSSGRERTPCRSARCGRETDAGIERVVVNLPAVITTDLRLNEPRYVSLPGIMRARKKPLEEITLADLGVNVASRTHVLALEPPPKRKAGVKVSSVEELVERLKNEAKVI